MKNPGDILTRTLDSFTRRMDERDGYCLPARRYSHFGEVAFDCEQFVVNGVAITMGAEGQPGGQNPIHPGLPVFTYLQIDAVVIRQVPNLDDIDEAPDPDELDRSATEVGMDVTVLSETFEAAFGRNSEDIVGACDNVYRGGVTWQGPQGDLIASILTFYVQL